MGTYARNVTVVGAGYVGLATTVLLLAGGSRVSLLDSDEERVRMVAAGVPPVHEPGLAQPLRDGLNSGNLRVSTQGEDAFEGSGIVFMCVGTPESPDGSADLSAIRTVLGIVRQHAATAVVVIKSSVPPGTTHVLSDEFPDIPFVVNPEFLRQGSAVADALDPNRVVLGGDDPEAIDIVRNLYAPLARKGCPIVTTDPTSAELIKYASNSFLALKVAFVNEVSDLCEAMGANVGDVVMGMGLDPRIGHRYLKPGPGFGGSCLPKDAAALNVVATREGVPMTIVDSVIAANVHRRESLSARVQEAAGVRDINRVGVLGLTFKAGTDDTRESPAIDLARGFMANGVDVAAYDPMARDAEGVVPGARLAASALEVFDDADVVVVATEWPEFSEIDFRDAGRRMAGNTVVDLRGILDRKEVEKGDLRLVSLGSR